MRARRTLLPLLLLAAQALPWLATHPAPASAAIAPSRPLARPLPLSITVQPAAINVGRDVSLHVTVKANGKLVSAMVSITGAGNPAFGNAAHGAVTIVVHAAALGKAEIRVIHAGFTPVLRAIPVIAGSPATVMAIKAGVSIAAPHAAPRPGQVGNDLYQDYHALTARKQLASIGLRDGSLVDLNANTDVVIKDPLHATLNAGELFLQVVHGGVSHLVQAGTAVAATKGTRLDVRYVPGSRTAVVTVIEGKVQVSNKGKSQLVGAGQQSTVVANRAPSAPRQVSVASILAWVKTLPNSSSTTVPPAFVVPPPTPLALPSPPAPRTPNLTLTGNLVTTTVSGVAQITGLATVPAGSTLTIDPGAIVEFAAGAQLDVVGTLHAAGTANAPIIFTSAAARPLPGDWQDIRIEGSGASQSVLDHVQGFYGGHDNYYGSPGMILVLNGANITIRNSSFQNDATGAISVDDHSTPTISNCSFANDPGNPLNVPVDLVDQITNIHIAPGQSPFTPRSTSISHSTTWFPMSVPIVLTGTVYLLAGATLTLAPGTTVQMGPGAQFIIQGVLHAVGTAAAPITFTSAAAQPAPGDWQNLRIEGKAAAGSVFDHTQFFYGGHDNYYGTPGMFYIHNQANITIRNSTFAQDNSGAISVGDSARPTITNCLFADDVGSPISAPVDMLSLFTHLHLAAGQSPIVIGNSTISTSATWIPMDVPVVITGTVFLGAKVKLTLAPGTVLAFGPGAQFVVQGTLHAVGTPDAPITFTSAAAQPAPGDWQDFRVESKDAAATVFTYTQFLYGGHDNYYGSPGMLLIHNDANIVVANSTFAEDAYGAITVGDTTRPTITGCLFVDDAGSPITAPVDTLALFTQLHFGAGQAPIVSGQGTITTSATWLPMEVPVVLTGTTVLDPKATLTVAAGATFKMGPGALFEVDGVMHAKGVAGAPVTFTSAAAHPAPGDWQDFRVQGATAAASVFDHTQFYYGGHDNYYGAPGMILIRTGANVMVIGCTFANGASGGIFVDNGTLPRITASSFHDLADAAITLPAADEPLVKNNTFGPGQKQIVVHT